MHHVNIVFVLPVDLDGHQIWALFNFFIKNGIPSLSMIYNEIQQFFNDFLRKLKFLLNISKILLEFGILL